MGFDLEGEFVEIGAIDIVTQKFLCIGILEETSAFSLVDIWDNEIGRSYFLLFSEEDIKIAIQDNDMDGVVNLIGQTYKSAQSALALLNRKRISQIDRYASRCDWILDCAVIALLNTLGCVYLDRAMEEGKEITDLERPNGSRKFPQWLLPAYSKLRYYVLNWLDRCPTNEEDFLTSFWLMAASFSLNDLNKKGVVTPTIERKQLKSILNDYIFEGEEGLENQAITLCGRAIAIQAWSFLGFGKKTLKELSKFLDLECKRAWKRKHELLPFERTPILPFGFLEETIAMKWRHPSKSNLEILHGGVGDTRLFSSKEEIIKAVKSAIEHWRARDTFLQEGKTDKLGEIEGCFLIWQWLVQQRRSARKTMRSLYGIDMGRQRILRKARPLEGAEAIARRAYAYAHALMLETAADAFTFNFDWVKTELIEQKQDSKSATDSALKRAAREVLAVLEAEPLFHIVLLQRTSQSVVREMESYFLSGVGANIRWWSFKSLRKSIVKELEDEGETKPSSSQVYERFLERLPEAVLNTCSTRQVGDFLNQGPKGMSFRNAVANYLRGNQSQHYTKEQTSPENKDDCYADPHAEKAIERFTLIGEVGSLIEKEIARSHLSEKEKAVLRLKLQGLSRSEIARHIGISEDQVNVHRSRAYRKNPDLKRFFHRP